MPEEPESWTEPLDATSYGYVCPLIKLPKPAGELLVPHRYWPMDEQCLNLNVWTPVCDGRKRPVLVWLHGGGYRDGSAIEQVAYEGENLSLYGDAVVVSVNHRLNILGYFDLSAYGREYENSANAGTEDIVAALRWIRRNIAAFGGDPGSVTLFGQSGGGGKVTTLLQTPSADGLFHRGVNMSGVLGVLDDSLGDGKDLAEALMAELGISGVKELEKVSWRALFDAYLTVSPALKKAGKYTGCAPKKNAFYAGNPLTAGFRKETADIPLLVGSVFGEFSAFTPTPYDRKTIRKTESRKLLAGLLGKETDSLTALFRKAYPDHPDVDLLQLDCLFRSAGMQYIRRRAALNGCTWSYLVDLEFPIDGGRVAWHCSDIPLFFHNAELLAMYHDQPALLAAQERAFGALMAFARGGNPGWSPCTAEEEHTMLLSEHARVVTNHDEKLIPALYRIAAEHMAAAAAKNADSIAH